jgi:predicted permease
MKRLEPARELHESIAAMRTIWQDLRFAFRLLTGSPGFALVAALTLALGIASTATVFTWIDSLLLHPYPGASSPDELSVLEMQTPTAPNGGTSLSWVDYEDFRDHLKLVSNLALQRQAAFALGDADDARLVWGELVSGGYFDTLGVRPLLGSMFVASRQADMPGAYPVAVISARLWRSYFRADRRIIGKTVRLNRWPVAIVGVAPEVFRGTAPGLVMDIWAPASMGLELGLMSRSEFTDRGDREFNTILVRRRPGVTTQRAEAEVKALAATQEAAYPKTNHGVSATLSPPWRVRGGVGELLLSPLRILMAVAVVLLLIVCANVGNLLLARSVARHREFGIRIALGASRWRVARQLITEALLLAGAAGIASLLLLLWMSGSLISLVPSVGLPLVRDAELNLRVFGFLLLVCLAGALISGLAPVLVCFNPSLNEVLKEGGQRASPTGAARRTRSALVIAEVALAATALIGAGLFLRSFRNARAIHPGFDTQHVLFARFFIESTGYSGDQVQQLMLRLREALEAQPGVEAVSYSDFTPLSVTAGPYARVRVDGYTPAEGESMSINRSLVAPGFFAAVHIPILDGRDFTNADDRTAPQVMIVNELFARRYFHGGNPIGRTVQAEGMTFRVVGLARDSKYFHPAEAPRPFFYVPFRQIYSGGREVCLFVRTAGEPMQAISMLRRVVARVDPAASAFHAVPLAEYTQVALLGLNVAATLMTSLGLMCLALAAIGIYSVMAYMVSQRTQEIGIRLAMGARGSDVIVMVVRQGMWMALAGLAVGMTAALAGTHAIGSMLIQVKPADPATFLGAAFFLLLVSLLATWLPAWSATHIDPMAALRRE